MTRILALDTTSEFGSLALLENGEVTAERLLHSAEGFGQVLFEHVRSLLDAGDWPLESVDCFAVAMRVYRLVKSKQLPAIRVGKNYRIKESDVDRYLNRGSE